MAEQTCPKCGAKMRPSQYGGYVHQGPCVPQRLRVRIRRWSVLW